MAGDWNRRSPRKPGAISHQPLERELPDEESGRLLVLADLSQWHYTWAETVPLLRALQVDNGRGLARGLAVGGLAGSLLRT
jgi:hypothetical protein